MNEKTSKNDILQAVKNYILSYDGSTRYSSGKWYKFLKTICDTFQESDIEIVDFHIDTIIKIKHLAFDVRRYYRYTNGSDKVYMDDIMKLDTKMLAKPCDYLYCSKAESNFSSLERRLIRAHFGENPVSYCNILPEKVSQALSERVESAYRTANEVRLYNHKQTLDHIAFSNVQILESAPVNIQKTFVFLKIHHKEKEYRLLVGSFNENNEFIYIGCDYLNLYDNNGSWISVNFSLFNKIKFKE